MTARSTFLMAVIVVTLLGFAASIYGYVTPSTGVSDTIGPLLTALGHAAMALGALLLLLLSRWRGLLVGLFILAAVLTIFAAYLLQQPMILFPAIGTLVILPLGLLLGDQR
ncbi:hypothetical protein [Palleronia sp.]|uniref:hypothetical protein n=1 Tax=Palleronia sp. TaxID=1940284 RepID=UPI0035C847F3